MDKPRLYLETTIPSYLSSRPSRDIVILAHQELTMNWWENARKRFDLFISQMVIEEVEQGDEFLSKKRLSLIEDYPVLDLTKEVETLSNHYMSLLPLPKRALRDAFHLAFSTYYEMDFLLTWNCTHLANGTIRRRLHMINEELDLLTPTICTPEELLDSLEEA